MRDLLCRRKGHKQLGLRGLVVMAQAILSLSLALSGIDEAHTWLFALCQLVSSGSLFAQFITASDFCFVIRAMASFGRVVLSFHLATCGRFWPHQRCDTSPWRLKDIRIPFRILHFCAATRFFLNGTSLMAQFAAPSLRTQPFRGHDELRRRSIIRATGIPLHVCRGILKILLLTDTRYQRATLEITINFLRALILIPISTWSLYYQWLTPPNRFATSSAAAKDDIDAHQPPAARPDLVMASTYLAAAGPRRPSFQTATSTIAPEKNSFQTCVEMAAAAEEMMQMEQNDRSYYQQQAAEMREKRRRSRLSSQRLLYRLSSFSAFSIPEDEENDHFVLKLDDDMNNQQSSSPHYLRRNSDSTQSSSSFGDNGEDT
uniref:Uncharacterized protein n=1 Tax=Aureoumbra lagunensis TaxID=44058 RepID=A0A7S3NI18_9STRA|mmetsp:Transcript_7647/g.10636  ORF Transcript_7647/g.10636 Transcript_7647/m.10636 type:complete len:374 (-) Transcript_7647:51-1172(-)